MPLRHRHDLSNLDLHLDHAPRCTAASSSSNIKGVEHAWDDVLPQGQDLESSPSSSRAATPPPAPVPPSGGALAIAFRTSERGVLVPPAFYPGQALPTLLSFTLPVGARLPLALNPTLTLSLVGTLVHAAGARVLIDISVSLAEGLALWARDAGAVLDSSDTSCLPDGTYTLPLSVQVPASSRLPPTFAVPGGGFTLTYALSVVLTCDSPGSGRRRRTTVASASTPFELLPYTLPAPPPRILPHSFWVPCTPHLGKGTRVHATERWVLSASLPTGAYSPTAVIPLELCVSPPRSSRTEKHALLEDVEMSSDTDTDTSSECPSPSRSVYSEPDTVAIFRVTLVREERVGNALVHSVPIVARIGWLPLSRPAGGASARPALPLMLDGAWTHGYSTLLAGDAEGMHTARQSLSSTFALYIDVLFHSARGRVQTCDDAAKGDQPPYLVAHAPLLPLASGGGLTAAVDGSAGQRLWERVALLAPAAPRTLAVPIIIGSVSEPRDALYMHSWSDLQLTDGQDTSSPNAPPGRLIEGEALSNEDGWLCPPPCYATAIQDAPHVC